jgi:hypothetical protein
VGGARSTHGEMGWDDNLKMDLKLRVTKWIEFM